MSDLNSTVSHDESNQKSSNTLKPNSVADALAKSINQLSVSSSSTSIIASSYTSSAAMKTNSSCITLSVIVDSSEVKKSKSMNTLDGSNNEEVEKPRGDASSGHDFKLISPYGDWCAFQ